MFNKLGIKGRVLLLSLLPTSLLALVLGGYFISMQLVEMKNQLRLCAKAITEQLAPLAASAIHHQDTVMLQAIANATLEQPDIRSVTFLDAKQRHLVHAGPSMLARQPQSDGTHLAVFDDSHSSRFLLPITESDRLLFDFPEEERSDRLLGWVDVEVSHDQTLLRGYHSIGASLLLILFGLIVTALTAWRLGQRISGPIRHIKDTVSRLQGGHLDARLPRFGSLELDELAGGINRMAMSLHEARQELQHNVEQATEDLRQTLETVEIQNIELARARKEALEASRIKSEFLANMSHEIRTPLNGILGFTKLLRKSELDHRQRDYLTTIENSADSLLGVINDILDFSKIEAGKLVLERQPFFLRELLEDCLSILAPAAHSKRLELVTLTQADAPLQLIGDPLRLKQILINLVNNAIKFTQRGSVLLRAELEQDRKNDAQIRLSVKDTGIGLSTQEAKTLFRAFSQVDNSLSRQVGGTGLGLAISKRLVEQMGGEIGVVSTPNQGSEFWIRLRLPKLLKNEAPQRPLSGRRAILVEHYELTRQSLLQQLQELGLEVTSLDSLAPLLDTASKALQEGRAFDFAVLGVDLELSNAERLWQPVEGLRRMGCNSLVLCPTTEQTEFRAAVSNQSQLLAKPVCRSQLLRGLTAFLATAAPTPTATPELVRTPRILCVDDNPANLLLVQSLLSDLGASVTAADSGHAALAAWERTPFDVIFMDVQMPSMDGCQVTREIRLREARRTGRAIPIIALTAHSLGNERALLLKTGMNDYLSKPVDEWQLAQAVFKWTGIPLQPLSALEAKPEVVAEDIRLQVLDASEGLRLAAGKADLAADMLNMLLASLDKDRHSISAARQRQDREALLDLVHRLHGATRYCGVPQLREACRRCETLLTHKDPEADTALDQLDFAIERLFQEAGRLLPV